MMVVSDLASAKSCSALSARAFSVSASTFTLRRRWHQRLSRPCPLVWAHSSAARPAAACRAERRSQGDACLRRGRNVREVLSETVSASTDARARASESKCPKHQHELFPSASACATYRRRRPLLIFLCSALSTCASSASSLALARVCLASPSAAPKMGAFAIAQRLPARATKLGTWLGGFRTPLNPSEYCLCVMIS